MKSLKDIALEIIRDSDASERTKEATALLEFLTDVCTPEAIACTAALMDTWSDDQGVYNDGILYYLDYEINLEDDGQWHFEPLTEGHAEFFDHDLRNALRVVLAISESRE